MSRGNTENIPDNCEFVYADVVEAYRDGTKTLDFGKFDVIYDLAARVYGVKDLYKNPAILLCDNIETTVALLRAASQNGIKRYVYVSSSCIYDHPAARVPHEEDDIALCDTSYGMSKLVGEILCKYFIEQFGMDIRIARLFNVYGPRDSFQSAHVIPDFMRKAWYISDGKMERFPIIGDGTQTRDFTWAEDAADAIVAIGDKGIPGHAYNVGTGREISIRDLAGMICNLFSVNPVFSLEEAPVQDIRKRSASIAKIQRDTGWHPTVSLEDGLKIVRESLVPHFASHTQADLDSVGAVR
jgi:nucleoside-diphosphate-sugar epimerase